MAMSLTHRVKAAFSIARGEDPSAPTLDHLQALAEALDQAERRLAEAHLKEVLAGTALAVLLIRLNGGRPYVFKELAGKGQQVVVQRTWDGHIASVEVRLEPLITQ